MKRLSGRFPLDPACFLGLLLCVCWMTGCAGRRKYSKYREEIDRLNRQLDSQQETAERYKKEIEAENKKIEELNRQIDAAGRK